MKLNFTLLLATLWSILSVANAQTCGTNIFIDEFNTAGTLPAEWTEVNTSGRVTIADGNLKFDYSADQPSAYRTLTPINKKVTFSFDVSSTRNWVKCKMDILSSSGKYITGLVFGNDGVKAIQYATSLDASQNPSAYTGSLVGAYNKSTIYSIAVEIDFDTNTLSFYADGIAKATGIAFLEESTDVAKISITQSSMYNSEGRFFFDNIAMSNPGLDRSALSTNINEAKDLSLSAIISPHFGYTSEAYEALQLAINQNESVFDDCTSTKLQIDDAATHMESAISDFQNSKVNEDVITLYSDYGFSGSERSYKCGYYNGNLADFEDIPVSFKLKKGCMATFAQDVDGQGYSKVYIAQDNTIEINLPRELQKSISFMRVSPWFPVGKKGSLGKKSWSDKENLNTEWYYTWGMGQPSQNSGYCTPEVQFAPMSWSGGNGFSGLESTRTIGKNMNFNHHLAFNEPDLPEQSNMTVERALEVYPSLLASGLRIGSPGISHGGINWIKEFMDSCVARGYRVDFIAIHDYVRRSPAGYISRFKDLHDLYNVPIWVTEYNYGNPGMGSPDITEELAFTKIKAMTDKFDETDFIERYAWYFFFGGTSNLGAFNNNEITSTGSYYRDKVSTYPSYIQEAYEQGPNTTGTIENSTNSEAFTVYPNPVNKSILTVKSDLEGQLQLNLYSFNGKHVANSSTNQMDVSDLINGLYLLKIEQAGKTNFNKIVINN